VPIPFDEPRDELALLDVISEEYSPEPSTSLPQSEALNPGDSTRHKRTRRATNDGQAGGDHAGKVLLFAWFLAMAIAGGLAAFFMGGNAAIGFGLSIASVSVLGFTLFYSRILVERFRDVGMGCTAAGSVVGIAVMLLGAYWGGNDAGSASAAAGRSAGSGGSASVSPATAEELSARKVSASPATAEGLSARKVSASLPEDTEPMEVKPPPDTPLRHPRAVSWDVAIKPVESSPERCLAPLAISEPGGDLRRVVFVPGPFQIACRFDDPPAARYRTGRGGVRHYRYDPATRRNNGRVCTLKAPLKMKGELFDALAETECDLLVTRDSVLIGHPSQRLMRIKMFRDDNPVAWAKFAGVNRMAVLGNSGDLVLWIVQYVSPVEFQVHALCRMEAVRVAAVTPQGDFLVTLGSSDPAFAGHVWRTETGEVAGNLPIPQANASDFMPEVAEVSWDGRLVAASGDGRLVVWNLENGQKLAEISGLPPVKRLQILSRQYLLADGLLIDTDRQMIVWQYELGDGIEPWDVVRGSPDGRLWLAFRDPDSPEDYLLAGLDNPDHLVKVPLESGTTFPPESPGRTVIMPAMLLR
jgi:hypothetical protein